jgi:aminoglycoside/choline kinase family phosphotransferase
MSSPAQHRPDRSEAMDAFLEGIGMKGAVRSMLAGDASFRRYERVQHGGKVLVLMDAPPPWENVQPFIDVSALLDACGVSAPDIVAQDVAQGFLLLEDLGDALFTRLLKHEPAREAELYEAAVAALVAINQQSAAFVGALPPYDVDVYLREASLLVEWFLPQVMGVEKAQALLGEYRAIWRGVLAQAKLQQRTLVHRDYHADNLLWLADREGHRAVGMLDYQDALWGDPAYDLVSLLEDARRDVGANTVKQCIAQFTAATHEEPGDFAARYAVLGAQRNAKIIGIFTRLCVRDGKAHYLNYLPRVWAHFMNDLKHPLLAPVRDFIELYVPASSRGVIAVDNRIGGIA